MMCGFTVVLLQFFFLLKFSPFFPVLWEGVGVLFFVYVCVFRDCDCFFVVCCVNNWFKVVVWSG